MIRFLTKIAIWRNRELWVGFYTQSSIFQHTLYIPLRKLELRFAVGNNDWHIKYI